jgi:hypothetical protein
VFFYLSLWKHVYHSTASSGGWLEVFSAAQDLGGNDGSSVTDIANLCAQCDALPRFFCPWFAFRLENSVSGI